MMYVLVMCIGVFNGESKCTQMSSLPYQTMQGCAESMLLIPKGVVSGGKAKDVTDLQVKCVVAGNPA